MSTLQPPTRSLAHASIEAVRGFLSGGAFPIFAISLLLSWEVFMISMLWIPRSSPALGAFAEDFRIWCFGYDPATGRTQGAYVLSMLMPQFLMASFIAAFWWQPMCEMLREPLRALRYALVGMLLVLVGTLGFAFSNSTPATGELPFPAEAIRTAFVAPQLSLTNQEGDPVDLAELRGRVVVLTAVYASCGHTCPLILTQTKAALAELTPGEVEDLSVVAVTLDPSNDSAEVLARLADGYSLEAPLYNLVTGPGADVERVLDDMQVARKRDPETGVIDHANIFLLIDRDGKIAYRLGLGERQQAWLTAALRVLLKEPAAAG